MRLWPLMLPTPSLDPAVPDNLQLYLLPLHSGLRVLDCTLALAGIFLPLLYVAGWYLLPRLSPGLASRAWGEMV